MTTPLLSVNQLSKSFGTRRAVESVSFTVQPGQTLGLLGPNGAGKSTTVSMICGLLHPDGGEVLMGGDCVSHTNGAAKRRIGLVPQDLALYEDLPARDNLKLFGALYGMKGAQLAKRCDEVLELVNLSERAGDKPAAFSGGMKRRLNIAAALLHDPELLILDEPTVGVDPQSRNAIFDTLETLQRQGRALIYTSHYMEEVERLAQHIVIIDHGKVIADESPASLYQRLPAQAALRVDLAARASDALLAQLKSLPGVAGVERIEDDGNSLHVALVSTSDGIAILQWLKSQGCELLHFATAKANLEDIFLTLTGRSLRD
jgi:ABC-2 type transport system ATP-binding protein